MAHKRSAARPPSPPPGESSDRSTTFGWTRVKLGDPEVAVILMGQSPDSATYNTDQVGLPFFQGKADFGLRHPIPTTWCSSPVRTAEAGDILLSVRAPVGDVNVATDACCIGRRIAALRPGPAADTRFLFYLLLHHQPNLDSLGSGAIFKAITKSTLHQFEIQLPPMSEQNAIATILWKAQEAVEVQDKIVAGLKELKAATMAKLFREGLRGEPLKQTEIGELPESWQVVRLDSIADLLSGGTPSKVRPEWWEGPIPWASPKDMKRSRLIDTEDHISREALDEGSRLVPAGTVFVVVRGMILAKNLPVARAEVPMAFNQDMKAVLPRHAVDSDYLLYALMTRKEALAHDIATAAHGTRRMGTSSLEGLRLPLPPATEQKDIADALSRIEQGEDRTIRTREEFKSLFSSMLHNLMTGQVRVPLDLIGRLGALPGAGQGSSARGGQSRAAGQHGKPDEAMLQEIVRRIVAAVAPEEIILFGSAARGEMGPDSDIDLLVVKACEHRREVARAVRDCLRGVAPGRGKDVVVVTPEDVERDRDTIGYIIRPALRDGRVLYAA